MTTVPGILFVRKKTARWASSNVVAFGATRSPAATLAASDYIACGRFPVVATARWSRNTLTTGASGKETTKRGKKERRAGEDGDEDAGGKTR